MAYTDAMREAATRSTMPSRAYQPTGDDQMSSWPTQVTKQGQQSIELHNEAARLTGNGSRTRRLSTKVQD